MMPAALSVSRPAEAPLPADHGREAAGFYFFRRLQATGGISLLPGLIRFFT